METLLQKLASLIPSNQKAAIEVLKDIPDENINSYVPDEMFDHQKNRTLLQFSVDTQSYDVASYLLKRGADPYMPNGRGESVMTRAALGWNKNATEAFRFIKLLFKMYPPINLGYSRGSVYQTCENLGDPRTRELVLDSYLYHLKKGNLTSTVVLSLLLKDDLLSHFRSDDISKKIEPIVLECAKDNASRPLLELAIKSVNPKTNQKIHALGRSLLESLSFSEETSVIKKQRSRARL